MTHEALALRLPEKGLVIEVDLVVVYVHALASTGGTEMRTMDLEKVNIYQARLD